MPNTYFDSELTGAQIETALKAIHGVVSPSNNGKVLAIENGAIVAKSASEWTDTPVLEPLSATANGDYTPGTGVDGFNYVHVAVPSGGVVQPLNVTANGTYNPPSGVDGYAPVVVSVSGGSIPVILKSDWDAMTTEQKQAYGLCVIQTASSGFERGKYVNGADYSPIGIYLPYSNAENVICEAYGSIYDPNALSWGRGNKPITLSAAGSVLNADGSVSIMTKTNGTLAYVDLGTPSAMFTAYFIGKIKNSNGSYTRLLSCMEAANSNRGIMLYGDTINVSSWGNDTSITGPIYANHYFVGVIQFAGSGSALGTAISAHGYTPNFISKSPNTAGQYLTIGRTNIDPNLSPSYAEPTDMDVLYLGVTNFAEDRTVIANNMEYLAQQFLS